jgi:hypothetical protein
MSMGRLPIKPTGPICFGARFTASDGSALCSVDDGKGLRTITGTDKQGVARKATVSLSNSPTSSRVEIKYFANNALQLTLTHVVLSAKNDQIAVVDPSNFAARFDLVGSSAYFYEMDESGQRYGEVYGPVDPNATGDAKYPPHFFDEFRSYWQPAVSSLGEYFAPALEGDQAAVVPFNERACGALAGVAAEIACDSPVAIWKRAACKEAFKALLEDMCNYVDTVGPTIGGTGGGGSPNTPGASVGGNTGSGGGKQSFDSKDCTGQNGSPCP